MQQTLSRLGDEDIQVGHGSSDDQVNVLVGPVTRARAKKFKESLHAQFRPLKEQGPQNEQKM